ncbi:hypothetical protein AVEN_120369-1 [Araneus ventricosus]|uniref:Uncharacterized protein n=1 Tax=Araneus ventricosus TaxID=182803 RepID=A0A4Y2RHW5_ARAVE|nr:hypothetical protein AVEN_120369-1 [Araneus ventricosus]
MKIPLILEQHRTLEGDPSKYGTPKRSERSEPEQGRTGDHTIVKKLNDVIFKFRGHQRQAKRHSHLIGYRSPYRY